MRTRVQGTISGATVVDMAVFDCPTCGVVYGITTEYEARRREDQGRFLCPNGHGIAFKGDTQADRLKRELEWANERLEGERRRLEAERRSHAATKGQLTKVRNRVQNGTCPDCNRHFVNLERHMANKHPHSSADVARAKRDREAML